MKFPRHKTEKKAGTYINSRFSLVISDWSMPEVDGLELCRRIRGSETTRYCYVILLTALQGKSNYLQAMRAGTDDFITKPFDPDECGRDCSSPSVSSACRIA